MPPAGTLAAAGARLLMCAVLAAGLRIGSQQGRLGLSQVGVGWGGEAQLKELAAGEPAVPASTAHRNVSGPTGSRGGRGSRQALLRLQGPRRVCSRQWRQDVIFLF